MKLQTEIMALCDYALIDQSGKLSIIGVFDFINVNSFPGGLPKAYFVTTIKGEPFTGYSFTIKVENQNRKEKPVQEFSIKTNPSGKFGKSNLVLEIVNLAFKEPGDYEFVLYLKENNKEEKIDSIELQILDAKANDKQRFVRPN
ncbi:hypothetical protein A3A74_00180 [Candidatus Roizmanbacteria bacterium RIFCSPLOWO2_01_FULL_35_13]|uniref:Uncharacterized protein n=1 Tax=Candidatus Roizmanbacteria bacterium RIFCSPLOWO2_01_FULL_35_13 TaxID=1802055 RepID=A0A1F7IFC0_9BACT|nr:MAG: hypothetical protein A3A74_00180 [Candidatus Roizmanbacteria bacterium RIFCSPLOWO2_01_FULL_35_13]